MFSHSQVSKLGFRIQNRTMKSWKTMVKRVKEVSPHLEEEISYAHKYLLSLSIYGNFVSVKHGKRA
jgi:hypothetical protein